MDRPMYDGNVRHRPGLFVPYKKSIGREPEKVKWLKSGRKCGKRPESLEKP